MPFQRLRRDAGYLVLLITQYWHTSTIPTEVLPLISTFRLNNPDCEHVLFNEATAEDFIAAHFSEREVAAFRACAVPAMQADYLRYCALLVTGGLFSDADTRCLQSLRPLFEQVEHAHFFRRRNGAIPNGYFITRSPGHELLRFELDVATLNIERKAFSSVWLATGPGILTVLSLLHWGGLENYQPIYRPWTQEDRADFLRLADIVRSVAGNRIHTLFDRALVSPISDLAAYLIRGQVNYKNTTTHWLNWPGSIYR